MYDEFEEMLPGWKQKKEEIKKKFAEDMKRAQKEHENRMRKITNPINVK